MLSIPRILPFSCLYFVACAFPLVCCSFPCLHTFLPCVCFPSLSALHSYCWFPHLSSFYSLACMLSFSLSRVSPFFCMYFSSLVHFPHLTVFCFFCADYSYLLILAFTFPSQAHFPSLMQSFSSFPVLTWKLSISFVYFPALSHACDIPHVYS